MAFYENLGFENHPFAKTNADEEPHLEKYFVPPPFFDAVLGDPKTPNASVVLAPRGGGKTALRRMVEDLGRDKKILAVTYDRFEFTSQDNFETIGLQYHLRNIIIRILISYLSYLSEYPDVLKNLDKQKKKALSLFIHSYIGDMTGNSLQELLNNLKSLPEKFRDFWNQHVGVLESVINFLLKQYGLETLDLPDIKQEEKKLSSTYKYQLELLREFVNPLGFQSIYVLIDKVDETEQTGNNPSATYQLIGPMIRDLDLLGLQGYGFKFFLWDKVEPYYKENARPDRVHQYQLSWKRESLQAVLSARLSAFSNGKISSFESIMEEKPQFNIDALISVLANGSPRNLIRLCEKILAVQAEANPNATKIKLTNLDQATIEYSDQTTTHVYGDDIVKDLQRVGSELFTINHLANDIFKVSQNAIRNKVTRWTELGAVAQISTVSVPTSKRPLNFYCIVDPALVRLIHRRSSLELFFTDRWLPCKFCKKDNLMDISLFPKDNVPVCIECGREII
jgi:hypothetical protein